MDDTMAPPSKRRKVLAEAEDVRQRSEAATKPPAAPFSHGVEHIPASPRTQSLEAQPLPRHVEEVHLEIHKRSVSSAEERARVVRRQGTAATSDILSTNSDADVVVAVTANVDVLGSTTALTTASLTVDIGLPSGSSTSTTTAVVSDDEPESSSTANPDSSTGSTASVTSESSAESTSSAERSSSESASSSDRSSSSGAPSPTSTSNSTASSSGDTTPTYAVSPASENGDDDDESSTSASNETTESGTGSSVAPSSTADTESASSSSASSSQVASLESGASSNSSMPAFTSTSSQSQSSQIPISSTGSGFSAQTAPASSSVRLNMTTSASTYTSGSAVFVSDFTANSPSSTSDTDSQVTDSGSSIDLNLLYLATQSDGDVETFTKSDEPFTTHMNNGQTAIVPASSTGESSSRTSSLASSGSVSESVTTISNDQTTVRSTVFSTVSPSSTQGSPDASGEPNGVGVAGAAGDGATATSNGVSSTSVAADTDDGNDDPAPAGTIAGGVVGGAAGLALVILIILVFLRRYKKRAQLGHRALPPNAAGPIAITGDEPSSGGPGMAERAGLMPFAGAVPALFRHQTRSQHSGSETGERGFQRVAGRKLPSAFSEGMTGPSHQPMSPGPMSPPPTMPLVSPDGRDGNLSSQSFYRDSTGFYGGDGSTSSPDPFADNNVPAAAAGNTAAEQMIMSPGPQRRPTIHAAKSHVQDPSVATSGVPSWTPSHTAAFARSETPASLDSGRNSRFTEEV